ncbi:uncharacterized protein LOC113978842 isoform X1 [Neopelma chrysocephalum]|uniref:uncharacterized protein LOC113978842 isoform X1 n=1 Tax=Neopelma chrysocephalum TaxID=114329 RepID=UPI000FCCED56|nr:uncharacterized protein LOC113978842 isoform X1 [Neopelma chrysocephalum]
MQDDRNTGQQEYSQFVTVDPFAPSSRVHPIKRCQEVPAWGRTPQGHSAAQIPGVCIPLGAELPREEPLPELSPRSRLDPSRIPGLDPAAALTEKGKEFLQGIWELLWENQGGKGGTERGLHPTWDRQSSWDRQILALEPRKAGPWRPSLSDVAAGTRPPPAPAAVAMLVSPRSCSEELWALAGALPAPVPME